MSVTLDTANEINSFFKHANDEDNIRRKVRQWGDAEGCTRIQYMFSKCVKCQKSRFKPDELAYFKTFGKTFTNFSLNKNDLNTYFCESCMKIVEAYLRTYQTGFATEENLKFTTMWNDALYDKVSRL